MRNRKHAESEVAQEEDGSFTVTLKISWFNSLDRAADMQNSLHHYLLDRFPVKKES